MLKMYTFDTGHIHVPAATNILSHTCHAANVTFFSSVVTRVLQCHVITISIWFTQISDLKQSHKITLGT